MPRPSNTQQRRREIADALARLMATEGYDGASIAAIAREAGVATGAVHYHFESKAEILSDLVERLVEAARHRISSRAATAADPRERLTAILDGLLATGDDARPQDVAVWSLVAAEAVRNDEVRQVYSDWTEQAADALQQAFADACRAEHRTAAGAKRAAVALLALTEGYYTLAAAAPESVAQGSAAPSARRIAHALLDAQPGAA